MGAAPLEWPLVPHALIRPALAPLAAVGAVADTWPLGRAGKPDPAGRAGVADERHVALLDLRAR
jgi:hypothetical protein